MEVQEQQKSNYKLFYFSNFSLFQPDSIHLLCRYKFFMEGVIMQLGQDWKIESTLFTEQINAIRQVSNNNHQFKLFNEFMSSFLKNRYGSEYVFSALSQNEVQEKFLQNVNENFLEEEIKQSLTFKTLSLGFCITASEVWNKTFTQPPEVSPKNVNKFKPFAKFTEGNEENDHGKWSIFTVEDVGQPEYLKIRRSMQKVKNTLSKAQVYSSMVCYVNEIRLPEKTIRIFELANEFYQAAFIIWLIFNIKMSFTLSRQYYLKYCKNYFGVYWNQKYEPILEEFKKIIDNERTQLIKDYKVALQDDIEVLKMGIDGVRKQLQKQWESCLLELYPSHQN